MKTEQTMDNEMLINPFQEIPKFRLTKTDKMNLLKNNIQFLQGVRNAGVLAGEGMHAKYEPFLEEPIYRGQIEDWIMDLSQTLYKETQGMFNTKQKKL